MANERAGLDWALTAELLAKMHNMLATSESDLRSADEFNPMRRDGPAGVDEWEEMARIEAEWAAIDEANGRAQALG